MYEYKSYEQWLREDAKGPKRTIFVASMLVAFLSVLCGVVIWIIIALAAKEQRLETSFSPREWALVACLGMAGISYAVHNITESILTGDYGKYVFKKLYGKSMLLG
ncbi:hypothetical protein A2473_00775 [candidate division WWE3 bacterium RIFOXYC2_FULL_42_13]|uniref:Uncharacterized protein n=1 Tax=candidate division WWE3 bacterium TaxID=2053526 RepID=A0A3D0ZQV1_UNCKA|nr:MAG: hypothetical protein A2473_00775 [candidate division WWE3 bacterium RIFOXYC2_FULL_42_13]OGC72929.1 MAG: hypothetical protein A2337_04005 [candidate division WWE3 bacterium RIFOXYB2_FULL_43_9]OGC75067.1 MAG: hypothetical protein A2547_01185 [candidate division WWE3 bacterium RIFOXYD2_FULL_43_10]HBY10429.1 hypothetical protein [candidate division WWE3 bacterium]HCC42589.1 hypothetical protein [candidate division WWE3 bacterium]